MSEKISEKPGAKRVALVLGGSGDIGFAAATALAQAGCDIVLVGRQREALESMAHDIANQCGVDAHAIAADLTTESAADEIVAEVIATFGRLDVLVSAAAEFKQGNLLDLSSKDWDDGFAAMFFGAVRAVKAAWPHLMKQKGHVILITGVFAVRPRATGTLAGAIASALLNFSKSAAELGMRDGVTVNSVLPGPVAGKRFDIQLGKFAKAKSMNLAEAEKAYAQMLGVERVARPEEVGKLIAFLVSDSNSFMRGASIVIDGGMTRAL